MESSGLPPDCVTCGWVQIIPENYEIVEFVTTYTHCLVDGYGGINISAIVEMFNITEIEATESNMLKVTTYLKNLLTKRSEETKDG